MTTDYAKKLTDTSRWNPILGQWESASAATTPEQVQTPGVAAVAGGSAGSTMRRINSTHYEMAQDGRTLAREEKFAWLWVLRNPAGNVIDTDRYRADLAERNGLTLLEPNGADQPRMTPENQSR